VFGGTLNLALSAVSNGNVMFDGMHESSDWSYFQLDLLHIELRC